MFRKLPVSVFDHNDGGVHEDANRQGQTAERHDVRGDVEVVHRDEGCDHGDRQGQDGNQRGTKVEQENDDHDADDDSLFEQVALQRFDGGLNQSGAVVSGDHFDARWQRGFDFEELLLDAIDDAEGIHPVAHHDNPANRFPFSLPLRNSFTNVRPERDYSQITDEDRRAVLGCYRNCFQVAQRMQIAESANHVFRSAHFKQPSTNFVRTGSNSFDDR